MYKPTYKCHLNHDGLYYVVKLNRETGIYEQASNGFGTFKEAKEWFAEYNKKMAAMQQELFGALNAANLNKKEKKKNLLN